MYIFLDQGAEADMFMFGYLLQVVYRLLVQFDGDHLLLPGLTDRPGFLRLFVRLP